MKEPTPAEMVEAMRKMANEWCEITDKKVKEFDKLAKNEAASWTQFVTPPITEETDNGTREEKDS